PLPEPRLPPEPPPPHRPLARTQVALQTTPMRVAVPGGNDRLGQHPPDRLPPRPPEGGLGRRIPVDDHPARVHRDKRLVRTLQHRAQVALAANRRQLPVHHPAGGYTSRPGSTRMRARASARTRSRPCRRSRSTSDSTSLVKRIGSNGFVK